MKANFKKKILAPLLIIFGLSITLSLILALLEQKQELRRKATVTETITVSLSPEETTRKPGETLDVDVVLSTTEMKQIRVGGADLQFSPGTFEVSSVSCNTTNFPLAVQSRSENNKILLTCSKQGGQDPLILAPNSPVVLGTIQLRVKTGAPLGTTSVTFLRANVPEATTSENLVNQTTEARYTIVSSDTTVTPTLTGTPEPTSTPVPIPTNTPGSPTVTPALTPNPTPTETPGPTSTPAPTLTPDTPPILNFKIKFDGVNDNIGIQKVVVKIKGNGFEKTFEQVEAAPNEEGILTGNLTLNGVRPNNYTISIKGPKHLGVKFCENRQKNRCSPDKFLSLNAGENNFDFATLPLLTGDIPDENGHQDGVVDINDFALLKQGLISTDPDLKARCNLDFNKDSNDNDLVNGRDVALFLKTLSIRYDDE